MTYNTTVVPVIAIEGATESTITLNGAAYVSRTPVTADGTYVLEVVASDAAGNTTTESVTFTIDTTAPVVEITGVTDGETYDHAVTPIVTIAGATESTITLDGLEWVPTELSEEGTYILSVVASDAFGNTATETVTFTISAESDTTPPVITVTGVTDDASYDSSVTPVVTITGATESTITLNGATFTSGTQVTTPGTYTLVATAVDAAGNTATETVTFTITAPATVTTTLTAVAQTDSVLLDWVAAPATRIATYTIYRATSATGPFAAIGTAPVGTNSFTDNAASSGILYYYRVSAFDGSAGNLATSNIASAMLSSSVTRLWGPNRYTTGIDISRNNFPSADVVIIATGRNFADALAASGLAGSYSAPLLLSDTHSISSETLAEIARLGAKRALVMGSSAAVGNEVAQSLRNAGLSVTRFGGANRYETSILIAEEIERHEISLGRPFTRQVFLARGDNFPDALSLSPFAYALRAPILLTMPTSLPAKTKTFVATRSFTSVLVAGSTAAVSDSVANQLASAGHMSLVRVGGANRYETSAMIAEYGVGKSWGTFKLVGLATGTNFPDALTGGVAVGKNTGVLMVTTPDTLHPLIRGQFETNKSSVFRVQLFGGAVALSENVANQVKLILQ